MMPGTHACQCPSLVSRHCVFFVFQHFLLTSMRIVEYPQSIESFHQMAGCMKGVVATRRFTSFRDKGRLIMAALNIAKWRCGHLTAFSSASQRLLMRAVAAVSNVFCIFKFQSLFHHRQIYRSHHCYTGHSYHSMLCMLCCMHGQGLSCGSVAHIWHFG